MRARASVCRGTSTGASSAGFARWAVLPVLSAIVIFATLALPAVLRWRSEAPLAQISTDHYNFFFQAGDYAPAQVRLFANKREQRVLEMAARLGVEPPRRKIKFYLYTTYEDKAGRDHGRGEFDAKPQEATVSAVWNEAMPQVEGLPDALVFVEQAWGQAGHPYLALAAAAYAAEVWRGQPIASWGSRITAEEGPYALEFLTHADTGTGREGEFLSPLVHKPLAGELARWVVSRWKLPALRELYSKARSPLVSSMAALLKTSPQDLETGWREWLLQQAETDAPQPAPPPQPFFQRGVAFTQERWRDGGDYASSHIGEVLASLKELGVDSVSVSPFASMPGPNTPALIRFSGESDEGINNTTYQAHRVGLKVMLKPQVWLRGRAFSGDIQFRDARDRALWFARYRRWILHYARLAEQNGSDLFCIGNELGRMAQYEAEWRELIAAVRRIYRGPITYAAHWGEEFETLEFWDAVDYIGLNNYTPLTRNEDASATTLQRAAQDLARRVAEVHRRWQRPVIFTEVGFPSVRGGAVEPWNERVSSTVDPAEQARAYEAIFRAFYHQPWFYGMYWWKWYSTGYGGGPEDGMLTPMNKPAARIMTQWYRSPASPP